MLHAEFDGLSFAYGEYSDLLSLNLNIWPSEVKKRSDQRYAASVDQSAIMIQHVEVCSERKAFLSGDDAEGLCVQGA